MTSIEYHNKTSYNRNRMSGHHLDWYNQPSVFKMYEGFERLELPICSEWPKTDHDELFFTNVTGAPTRKVDLQVLAEIFQLTHSITARSKQGGQEFYFRSVASAGALYPFEMYMYCAGLPNVEQGLYYHDVAHQHLVRLRRGRLRTEPVHLLTRTPDTAPSLMIVLTSIFYRSSWKYRDRAYRYHLLDTGHFLENLVQALNLFRVQHTIHYDFNDTELNESLGIDPLKERSLVAVCIPGDSLKHENDSTNTVDDSDLRKYSGTAAKEENYSTILKAYEESAGNITASAKGSALRQIDLKAQGNQLFSQNRLGSVMTYAESVFKRRSLRNYVHGEMASNAVGGLLNLISADADSFEHSLDETLVCGFLAGKGSGIEPGFYLVNRKERTFGHVCHGDFVSPMTRICLEQDWLANCSLHFVFISDLKAVQENFGSRGYRYAMISAGRMGQRLYVACTSIKQGACGIGAFYDSEAADLLGLGESGRMLYLVGAGPIRKWTW